MLNRTISVFFVLLMSATCISQEFVFEHFGVDEGLPSSEIYDVYQDAEGYMWFATDKGLSRYNGYEFENFTTTDGLTGNVVLHFYPQPNGQVWCYSFHNKSLFYFDEVFQGFKKYKYNDLLNEHLVPSSNVKSVFLDEDNKLHIGGYQINGEIVIDNNGTVTLLYATDDFFEEKNIENRHVLMLPRSSSAFHFSTRHTNRIKNSFSVKSPMRPSRLMADWLAHDETAVFMHDSLVQLVHGSKENVVLKNKYSPIALKVLDSSRFFIGYEFGGGKIIHKSGRIRREFLRNQSVTDLQIDHEGGYWFTTLNAGVYYSKNPSVAVYNATNQKFQHINSLAKTNDNELLVGYKNGDILKLLKNGHPFIMDQPEKRRPAFVEYDSLVGKAYIHNGHGLRIGTLENVLETTYILKLSEPKDSSFFVSSNKRFYEIRKNRHVNTRDVPHRIYDVCVWNKDTLIGTPSGVYAYKNDSTFSLSNHSKLFEYRSEDIDINDSGNMLFVATQGAGVVVNDGKHVFNITADVGLKSNIVNEIYVENDNNIWVCTNGGLNRINFNEEGFSVAGLGKKDGLLGNGIEDIEIINDTVWVGTKRGLCYFPKNSIVSKKLNSPYLKLKEVSVNGNLKEGSDKVILTYQENEIDFVLEGISYANQGDLNYQYRLNKNQNWSSTRNRVVHFSSLLPGSYTFEAKMCIGNDNCSEKLVTYQFTVQPPFWKTVWFALLFLIVFLLLTYTFFKVRVLTYNKDITRELIRVLIKYFKRKEKYFSFKENGNEVRIKTKDILFIKSAGNYIDISTETKTHTVRMNIGKFFEHIPDRLEYVRIHRSYIVRIDKITSKSKNEVCIGDLQLPVSQSNIQNLKNIHF